MRPTKKKITKTAWKEEEVEISGRQREEKKKVEERQRWIAVCKKKGLP